MNDAVRQILERTQPVLERCKELTWLITAPEIIADNRYWRRLVAEHLLLSPLAETAALLAEAQKSGNESEVNELCQTLKSLLTSLHSKSNETSVLEVRCSEKDSVPFSTDLFSAYKAFAEKNGMKFSLMLNEKMRLQANLCGGGAYSLLKEETGLHQAVFPQGAQAKAFVSVYEKKSATKEILEGDVRIDVFHSGGAGGQNVNKVESAVRVTHLPTGTVAVCQDERSQLKNKERALSSLQKKVEQVYLKQTEKENSAAKAAVQKLVNEGKLSRSYDFRTAVSKNALAKLTAALNRDGLIADLF